MLMRVGEACLRLKQLVIDLDAVVDQSSHTEAQSGSSAQKLQRALCMRLTLLTRPLTHNTRPLHLQGLAVSTAG